MTPSEREEYGATLKREGKRNCCQAVIEALTCDDPLLTDGQRQLLMRLGAGFRTGMGGMEATCGALCGAVIVAGLRDGTPATGNRSRQLHQQFTRLSGASICRQLKSPGPDGKPLCPCDDCVRHAIRAFVGS